MQDVLSNYHEGEPQPPPNIFGNGPRLWQGALTKDLWYQVQPFGFRGDDQKIRQMIQWREEDRMQTVVQHYMYVLYLIQQLPHASTVQFGKCTTV